MTPGSKLRWYDTKESYFPDSSSIKMSFGHDDRGFPGTLKMFAFLSCCHSNRDLVHIKEKNDDIAQNDCFTVNHDISAKKPLICQS